MSLIVSAPGKVLIAGGYLVLDPKYSGVVVSTSSRFYTVVRQGRSVSRIQVRSPQFINAAWEARCHVQEDGRVVLEDIDSARSLLKNKFVYLAIEKVLLLVLEMKGKQFLQTAVAKGVDITIVGDNDFYSQRAQLVSLNLPSTLESLSKIPPFAPTNVALSDVHKTGLGSSAALITSLVTALLVHFGVTPSESLLSDEVEDRNLAHNVAQYIHCLAQGKVGSGFDVSSAVFGSHIYTRFDPAVLAPLMSDAPPEVPLLSVLSPTNSEWGHKVQPFRLPPLLRLMLADVDAGSDTPSLVGKVLKWRREQASEANMMWDSLSALNLELASALTALVECHDAHVESYTSVVTRTASQKCSEWNSSGRSQAETHIIEQLIKARTIAENIRKYMRQMGVASSVPIEPPEQTRLLDACLCQPGVIAGGVPGAGGYDAIWLLVIKSHPSSGTSPVSLVEKIWSSWSELDVSPLSAVESRERGVRLERIGDIPGLLDVLQ